jgi:hypothetical protein
MQLLTCSVDTVPCPPESQVWQSVGSVFSAADLGIDAAGIAHVYAWGFGAVLLAWLMGYGVSLAVGLIRKV